MNHNIEIFIAELKNKIILAGLNIDNLEYDVLKDETYNFIYHIQDWNSQIGRIKIGKRSSKMQILERNNVIWIKNETMETYLKNIDKWIEYIKDTKSLYNSLYNN